MILSNTNPTLYFLNYKKACLKKTEKLKPEKYSAVKVKGLFVQERFSLIQEHSWAFSN